MPTRPVLGPLPASPWALGGDQILPGGSFAELAASAGEVPAAPFGARLAQSFFLVPLPGVGRGPGNRPEDGGRALVVIAIWWKGSGGFEVSI